MTLPQLWTERFTLLKRLGLLALVAIPLLVFAFVLPPTGDGPFNVWVFVLAWLFVLPALFYFHFVVVWHWKGRYRGTHSDLWGALILIETSGWMKLVYLFRHLLPDAGERGRYADSPSVGSASGRRVESAMRPQT